MLCLANGEAKYFLNWGWTLICTRCALICPSGSLLGKVVRKSESGHGHGYDFFGSSCALERSMKASVWLISSIGT
jgi:hypothetical protein